MQSIGSKLNMPVRNAKLFPFGEPAPVAEEDKAAAATSGNMLEEIQVGYFSPVFMCILFSKIYYHFIFYESVEPYQGG